MDCDLGDVDSADLRYGTSPECAGNDTFRAVVRNQMNVANWRVPESVCQSS